MGFFSRKNERENIPKGVPKKIERITWNPKYSVHVEVIDAQHRELFAIMNRIADIYESGPKDLLPVLQDLVQYVMDHFQAENMVMIKASYPGVVSHGKEHDQFTEEVRGFLADYRKQNDQLTYRMLIYIRDWLLSHTQQVDMRYADYLIRTGATEKGAPPSVQNNPREIAHMLTPTGMQNLLDVMKMMAATEQLIADFYRTCAEIWEGDREFWMAVVAEEEKHAKNIERMAQIVAARPERFEIGRPFNQQAIRTIMTGVEGHLKRLKERQITRDRLMFVARDIEASLMEKSYGEIVRTSDVEYLELVREIVEDTANHKQKIEQRCQAVKNSGDPSICVDD